MRNAITAQEGQLNQKRREKEHAEALLNGIKDKLSTMKVQVAGMSERLAIEFKVVLDEILDQPRKGEQSIEELTADSEKMKKRLENMGEINPTAIEAYTEMKVRNDFIVEQRDDLVNAKESLLSTIEEVENTANQNSTRHSIWCGRILCRYLRRYLPQKIIATCALPTLKTLPTAT